ncbi:twin-arginine translocase TatA/TatE family subunit [Paenibacillus sp. 481]|uniref:twin-arginine translocase TatA/TatE family subunit n=1 Tax=Paenibacillus sp. 481 TaxID=2835869 RepID=UPI001E51C741|nr:twin-arginine translocase TatA/TatE family subunit [Paenibacillus sp. 481]UHA71994.1 twin-arginine translocase TatA/TatE family subunit [Paenibacillus sp. 481]
MLGNIGFGGILLLLIVALLLFGPNKLPELGRAFGRTLKEFKAGARDIMGDEDQSKSAHTDVQAVPAATATATAGAAPVQANAQPTTQPSLDKQRRLPE